MVKPFALVEQRIDAWIDARLALLGDVEKPAPFRFQRLASHLKFLNNLAVDITVGKRARAEIKADRTLVARHLHKPLFGGRLPSNIHLGMLS